MTVYEISSALASIDDSIIQECADMHLRYTALRQTKKRIFSFAITACICMTLAVMLLLPGALYPTIPLSDPQGNVSARYVPSFAVKPLDTDYLYPYKTEQELFAEADLIFSGTVTEIRQVKMDFDGVVQYHSLITIEVNECFKGMHSGKIIVKSEGFGKYDRTSTAKELLYELETGQRGVFLVQTVKQGEIVTVNNCSYDASQMYDARFFDGYRFGFLEQTDGTYKCIDNISTSTQKTFPTLNGYDYEQVQNYVKAMLSKENSDEYNLS